MNLEKRELYSPLIDSSPQTTRRRLVQGRLVDAVTETPAALFTLQNERPRSPCAPMSPTLVAMPSRQLDLSTSMEDGDHLGNHLEAMSSTVKVAQARLQPKSTNSSEVLLETSVERSPARVIQHVDDDDDDDGGGGGDFSVEMMMMKVTSPLSDVELVLGKSTDSHQNSPVLDFIVDEQPLLRKPVMATVDEERVPKALTTNRSAPKSPRRPAATRPATAKAAAAAAAATAAANKLKKRGHIVPARYMKAAETYAHRKQLNESTASKGSGNASSLLVPRAASSSLELSLSGRNAHAKAKPARTKMSSPIGQSSAPMDPIDLSAIDVDQFKLLKQAAKMDMSKAREGVKVKKAMSEQDDVDLVYNRYLQAKFMETKLRKMAEQYQRETLAWVVALTMENLSLVEKKMEAEVKAAEWKQNESMEKAVDQQMKLLRGVVDPLDRIAERYHFLADALATSCDQLPLDGIVECDNPTYRDALLAELERMEMLLNEIQFQLKTKEYAIGSSAQTMTEFSLLIQSENETMNTLMNRATQLRKTVVHELSLKAQLSNAHAPFASN